jgi:hypothetical protein
MSATMTTMECSNVLIRKLLRLVYVNVDLSDEIERCKIVVDNG